MAPEDRYDPRAVEGRADRFIVLSGCSGAGKSSLLGELARRGQATVEEPGRQIVKEQLLIGGDALPWKDSVKFAELAVSRAMHAMILAAGTGRVTFFDRGIVDAVSFFEHLGLAVPAHLAVATDRFRYRRTVFMVPPWREIFRADAERRHGFEDSVQAYQTLLGTYRRLGYEPVEVPRLDIAARADYILDRI